MLGPGRASLCAPSASQDAPIGWIANESNDLEEFGHVARADHTSRSAAQIGAKGQVRGATGTAGRPFQTDTCHALRRWYGADETWVRGNLMRIAK
jgi:hypothetical protein